MTETKEVVTGVSETEKVTKDDGELTDADLDKVSGGFGSNEHGVGGGTGGKVKVHDISFTKKVDVSTPTLF